MFIRLVSISVMEQHSQADLGGTVRRTDRIMFNPRWFGVKLQCRLKQGQTFVLNIQ